MRKFLLIVIILDIFLIMWTVNKADETEPVIEEPTPELVAIVEEVPDVAPVVEKEPQNIYIGEFKLTAYCPCEHCSDEWGTMTATGTRATAGRTIAVDPKKIPYGTEVIINGNTYIAEDCGGAIKGNRIDIYFDSHNEALNFGVQYADVFKVG